MSNCSILPVHLRCEYFTNPIGIDVAHPRLSWELRATSQSVRGARQTAYRVLVATTPQKLQEGAPDLWDSGKVDSRAGAQVEYAGKRLDSNQRAYWKVQSWDEAARPSEWSDTAEWSVGLLGDGWARTLPGADSPKWIGADIGTPWNEREAPPSPVLRRDYELNGDVRRATVYATALGLYELHLNGQAVGDRVLAPEWTDYRRRLQYQAYDVTALLRRGANAIGAVLAPGWYAGRIGLAQLAQTGARRGIYGRHLRLFLSLHAELSDGSTVVIRSDPQWKYTLDGPIRGSDLLDGETVDARRNLPGWDSPGFDATGWRDVDHHESGPLLVSQPNEPIRITSEIRPVGIAEPKPGVYVVDVGQEIAGWMRAKLRGKAGDEIVLRHAEMLNPDGTIYRDNLRNPPISPFGAAQEDRYICRGDEAGEMFEPRFTYHG
jgi:alpha-L-rhamnosidase